MSALGSIWAICAQNFRKWRTDYRIWTIAVLMLIMVAIFMDNMKKVADGIGADMPIWTFPFLCSEFHTKLIFTVPVILLFCSAPFIDENQMFVIMRAGRNKWLCGQILYIMIASALYYIFLLAATLVFTVFTGELTLDWGKAIIAMAGNPSVFVPGMPVFIYVNELVPKYFSPLLAVWFTFILSWFSAMLIGAVLFTCNYLTGTKAPGMTISTVLVIFPAVTTYMKTKFEWFSPISWNSLNRVDVGGFTEYPPFEYCMTVYSSLIILLFAAAFIFGRKKDLDKKG